MNVDQFEVWLHVNLKRGDVSSRQVSFSFMTREVGNMSERTIVAHKPAPIIKWCSMIC